MFKLLSQQAIRHLRNRSVDSMKSTLYQPLYQPLLSALRKPVQTNEAQKEPVPFSGPPSYETLARRFSSNPSPQFYYRRLKEKEGEKRGEFIDIHDIGPVDPKDYDVLLTDVNEANMRTEIADMVGIPYIQTTTKEEANRQIKIGECLVYGERRRLIFPCRVGFKNRACWVFFIVDTSSPLTYISYQTAKALRINTNIISTDLQLAGYGHRTSLSPEFSHFAEVNLLGADFLGNKVSFIHTPIASPKAELYFTAGWKIVPDE